MLINILRAPTYIYSKNSVPFPRSSSQLVNETRFIVSITSQQKCNQTSHHPFQISFVFHYVDVYKIVVNNPLNSVHSNLYIHSEWNTQQVS